MLVGLDGFRRRGERIALVSEAGAAVSFRELAERCESVAHGLGSDRQLVLLEAGNNLDSVVAYLACLIAGHPTILVGQSSDKDRIIREFRPSAVISQGEVQIVPDAPPVALHKDLALLLPTSGSTGSPKLVRLSQGNLAANADSIIEYLGITADDRAITSLPIHYSFGLSVLNSHLRAGACVVLTDRSVTDPQFWELVDAAKVTSIAGVPYSYELFERIGFRDNPPKSLKTLTQAGGRLAPELVRTYADFAARRGMRFFTMYGQTEAAPRMAFLPPELALANADCIGIAVPGGAFRLIGEDGAEIFGSSSAGELVYEGPNVMLGYAFARKDLAKGPELSELRTGDLAERTEKGLYRIVGRASRFVKIAGLRIGLDDVEAMLSEAGATAIATGDDTRIVIGVLGGGDPQPVRELVGSRCGLPLAAIIALPIQEAPRLENGKVDYRALLALGHAEAERATAEPREGGVVAKAYAHALGIAVPSDDASFSSLGGDSLAYVNASVALERELGRLPQGWEEMPISSLEAMVETAPRMKSGWTWLNSEMLVRVSAFGLILMRHASLGDFSFLIGGSNMLFALSGYSLARFQRDALLSGSVKPALTGMLNRVVLPYVVVMAAILPFSHAEKSWSWPFLLSVFFVQDRGPLWIYWFIESLVHALLITCALFLIPSFRRFAARRPFGSALAMLGGAVVLQVGMPHIWNDGMGWHLTVDAWLYVYFLGWAACMAREPWQRALVVALAWIITATQYGVENSRAYWLTLGLFTVLYFPRLKVPAFASRIVLQLALATYFIYITHIVPIHFLMVERDLTPYFPLNLTIVVIVCVMAGVAYGWLWNAAGDRLRRVVLALRPGLLPHGRERAHASD